MWDGGVDRECGLAVWTGSVGRECEPGMWAGILYLFRQFFAVWVEISNRRLPESLPFSAVSRLLGRDFQPAAIGISTFSAVSRLLGRDFQPAATLPESLPFSAVFPCLGRDLHPAATGFSTLFGRFSLFG